MKSTLFNAFRNVAYAVTFGILALAAVGCGSSEKGKDKSLTVSEKSVILDAEGGSQKLLVSAEGLSWIASASDSWVKVTPESGTGDSYMVIAAESNPSADVRTATVTIEAPGVSPVSIVVLQNEGSSATATFDPQAVMFTYYGDYFETGNKTAAVVMNILNKDLDSNYQLSYPYSFIQLVLNVPYSSDYQTAITSALGHTYTTGSSYAEYTIDLETSAYATLNSSSTSDAVTVNVKTATVRVSSASNTGSLTVTYDVKLEDGTSLVGSYSGTSVYAGDNTSSSDDYEETTLTGDVAPEFTSAEAVIYFNIPPESGTIVKDFALCELRLDSKVSGSTKENLTASLYMEYSAASAKELSEGTYSLAPSEPQSWADYKYSFDAGSIEDNYFYPTYYTQMEQESGTWYIGETYALISDGKIVISKSGNNYKFEINLTDAEGHKVTSTCTLPVSITVKNLENVTSAVSRASFNRVSRSDVLMNSATTYARLK